MTARITNGTQTVSVGLVKELELDRGMMVIGQPWTSEEMKTYWSDRHNHVYCWSDDIAESNHSRFDVVNKASCLEPDYTGAEGETWAHYRVCVGLKYGIESREDGSVIYRTKTIDHMCVDGTLGDACAYQFFNQAMSDLASRWSNQDEFGKVICHVNSKDPVWLTALQVFGFACVETTVANDEEFLKMELSGGVK